MNLFLVQHGEAVDKEVDPERPLTGKGEREVGAVGAFLAQGGLRVPSIWHSGKLRALQTAEILATHIGLDAEVEEQGGLAPTDPPLTMVERLRKIHEDVLLVGHLPHLAKLASLLLVGKEEAPLIAFKNGGVVCLTREDNSPWLVRWVVVPNLVRRTGM